MAVSTNVAAVGGIALAALAAFQYKTANDAQRQVVVLQHQLADKKAVELGAAKQSCADRAQRYFKTLGYDESKADGGSAPISQNHYSERFGRCLMTIETMHLVSPTEVIEKFLIDADEHKTFGEYTWLSSRTKKAWEQRPQQCKISPPEKSETYCQTTEEYDAYVKQMLTS